MCFVYCVFLFSFLMYFEWPIIFKPQLKIVHGHL
uniref:Uncharacterized protein n=1 Tax=Anguilla anguilla TaxID=7936 RepID=A0A0E9UYM1_ANGAN